MYVVFMHTPSSIFAAFLCAAVHSHAHTICCGGGGAETISGAGTYWYFCSPFLAVSDVVLFVTKYFVFACCGPRSIVLWYSCKAL